ncbi:MAG: serine/threonine-protein phosphatase [bacterium]|nr:serine/threonine-protein phosphatase [bacterium]
MQFPTAKISRAGGRESNQDVAGFVILETQKAACWVLADGLGGHIGGETASKTAVNAILEAFRRDPQCSPQAIDGYLRAAQKEILRLQDQNPRLSRMRTTIVILVTDFQYVIWGHLGDSRLYRFVGGKVDFQTKDHSVPQALVASGDITPDRIRGHEDRNRLLRSLGQPGSFRPHIHEGKIPLTHGDVFLLCSDGFWEWVNEPEMEIDLSTAAGPGQWLEKMERRILERARGEFDNYTAIAVFSNE